MDRRRLPISELINDIDEQVREAEGMRTAIDKEPISDESYTALGAVQDRERVQSIGEQLMKERLGNAVYTDVSSNFL